MYIPPEKIKDPNNSEREDELIISTFLRQLEEEKLQKKWAKVLEEKHNFPRPTTNQPSSGRVRKLLLLAASVAAAVLFLLFILPVVGPPTGADLLAAEISKVEMITYRNGDTSGLGQLRQLAREAYLAGEYPRAAQLGRQVLGEAGATTLDQYNLGVIYLQAEDWPAAVRQLTGVIEQEEDYLAEARFYRATAQLRLGDTASALRDLNNIAESDGRILYERARALTRAYKE